MEQSLTQLAASQTEQQARTPHLLEQQFNLLGKSVDTVREGVGRHEERMREILAKLDIMVVTRHILTSMARKFFLTGLTMQDSKEESRRQAELQLGLGRKKTVEWSAGEAGPGGLVVRLCCRI